jgi:pyrroline-5-carboxylate reductase
MSRLLTLGAGNMARALLTPMRGALDGLMAYTPSHTSAQSLAKDLKGQAITLEEMKGIEPPDFLFLSFKPQFFKDAVKSFKEEVNWSQWSSHTTVVSLLAGTPLEVLKRELPSEKIVRIMPNTPAMVGQGITLVCADTVMKEKHKPILENLLSLLKEAGVVFNCRDEDQFDAITAVTGSGPAYVFEFARILQDFLKVKGVSEKEARLLSVTLLQGASEMMAANKEDLVSLRDKVTSKKGVTLAALESLKEGQFESLVQKALEKNISRSVELRTEALRVE